MKILYLQNMIHLSTKFSKTLSFRATLIFYQINKAGLKYIERDFLGYGCFVYQVGVASN